MTRLFITRHRLELFLRAQVGTGIAAYRVDEGVGAVRVQLRFRLQDLFRWRARALECEELRQLLAEQGVAGIVYQVIGNCWPLWLRLRLR